MPKFEPGRSGNPGGRPRDQGEARRLARRFTAEAVFALVVITRDLQAPPTLRFRAALALLERGYGSVPKQEAPQEGDRGRFPGLRRHVLELLDQHEREEGRSSL
jgi:hypothetical protein